MFHACTIINECIIIILLLTVKIGKRHPDPVVETASLASVLPPEVYYKLHLPSETIDSGALSALQLESIVYAAQQHEHFLRSGERGGYLVGMSIVILFLTA